MTLLAKCQESENRPIFIIIDTEELLIFTLKTSSKWQCCERHGTAPPLVTKQRQRTLSDQQTVMEEGPAMEFPNLFFFLLTVTLQFTYSSEDTFTIHSYNYIWLNCALFVTCSSSNPWFFFSRAYVFSISDLRTMEIAKELTINLPERFQIKHYTLWSQTLWDILLLCMPDTWRSAYLSHHSCSSTLLTVFSSLSHPLRSCRLSCLDFHIWLGNPKAPCLGGLLLGFYEGRT